MQKILGLDIGATAIKGVLIESSFRGYETLDAASLAVPPAPQGEGVDTGLRARQILALKDLIALRGWHPDSVIMSWPGASAASHAITLPFSDPRRIEQTVQFEVEGQLPFDLAEVAWDWQILGTREGKTDLFVGVVKRDELTQLLAQFGEAGIDPRAIVPAGAAYAALYGQGALAGDTVNPALPAASQDDAVDLIVDIGHERTSVCVVVGGRCETARTFSGGSLQLRRTVARELGIEEAQAAALLEGKARVSSSSAGGEQKLTAAIQRGLLPVLSGIRTTVRAWQARISPAKRSFRRALLVGEAAHLPGMKEWLAPEVDAPVERIELAGSAGSKISAAQSPGMALALALALRGHLGSRAPRLNLRRGDLAFTRDFQHLKGHIMRLAAYASLIILLAIVSSWAKMFALSRHEAMLDKAICDTTQKVVGKCYTDPAQAVSVLKGKGTPSAAIPKVSSVDIFAELANRTPSDVPLKFDKIEITREKLHLTGTTDAAENVDKIVSALKASKCFSDARSGGARKRQSDSRFEFNIEAGLSCETPPSAGGGRG